MLLKISSTYWHLLKTAQIKVLKVLSEEDCGCYVVRKELQDIGFGDEPIEITAAYSKSGGYIGDPDDAKFLVGEKGIIPETYGDLTVCCIGFCEKEQKWYGWSHRAISGFGVGDTPKESFPWGSTKGKEIKTLEEAKEAAIAFAESVS